MQIENNKMGEISNSTQKPPNIVFILIDDMGWVDAGCYGSKYYQTPHIDKLASEGMRFTQAYSAAPVCAPTRTSLLTGMSPSKLRMIGVFGDSETRDRALIPATYFPLPDEPEEVRENLAIPAEYNSFGDVLKQQGYHTCYSGKWHSGSRLPKELGFDEVISRYERSWWSEKALAGDGDGEITKSVTADAVEYIHHRAKQPEPFMLYLNHFTVHVPLQADESTIDFYSERRNAVKDDYQTNILYAAMIKEMDDGVGKVLQALKDAHIENNTLVFFYSDNGGLSRVKDPKTGEIVTATNQYPLRSGKGTLYEGGIRVPFIARLPGIIPAGIVTDAIINSQDFYPTLANFAGGSIPSYIEGISFKKVLTGEKAQIDRDTLYFHYPQYKVGQEPVSAVRRRNDKMIYFWESKRFELYDLASDLTEQHDLSKTFPETVEELNLLLKEYLVKTNAPVPVERKNHLHST
jgi:arylsulfatase A